MGHTRIRTVGSTLALLAAGTLPSCGGSEDGPEPFVDGTCVRVASTGSFGTYCAYPTAYHLNHTEGDEWCETDPGRPEDGLGKTELHPLKENGSRVECAELGFPVECSNCTGRDFYYEEGKACKDCSGSDSSCADSGESCSSVSDCCDFDCPFDRVPVCGSSESICGCGAPSDTTPDDPCGDCLDACRGLSGCCTGTGCICDSACN